MAKGVEVELGPVFEFERREPPRVNMTHARAVAGLGDCVVVPMLRFASLGVSPPMAHRRW